MLKSKLQQPDILLALASAGHGAEILITDGHYPASTKTPADVTRVYLNLAPGLVSVTDLLELLADTIEIERATVMAPEDDFVPPVFQEFKKLLPESAEFTSVGRFEFYDLCVDNPNLCLVLVSGDIRQYANILLTIGVYRG